MSKKSENEPSPLLNINQACAYVGVWPSTLYKVVMPETGVVKVGRRTYLRRKALDAFIEANTLPPKRRGIARSAAAIAEERDVARARAKAKRQKLAGEARRARAKGGAVKSAARKAERIEAAWGAWHEAEDADEVIIAAAERRATP